MAHRANREAWMRWANSWDSSDLSWRVIFLMMSCSSKTDFWALAFSRAAVSSESREFAVNVQSSLHQGLASRDTLLRDRGVKKAPFIVLIGANMPSVLAEIGFLSSAREEALLKKPEYRDKLAEALFKGMQKYAEGLSHFQTAAKAY